MTKRMWYMLLLSLLISLPAFAEIPRTVHYQGRITDKSTNNPIANGIYSVRIALYESQSATATAWSDLFDVQTQSGYFETELGSNPSAPLNMAFDRPYWIGIKVGVDSEMSPRQPLSSVPYAFQANTVTDGSITSAKIANGTINGGDLAGATITASNLANGTITGNKIASTTITNANIANGAIDTQAKAPWAPQIAINGSWRNNAKIASGFDATDSNGNATISLAGYGFTQTPNVICVPGRGDSSFFLIVVTSISASSFSVKSGWPATVPNVGASTYFYWMAAGY